jgi:SAM-dependent methyltransferase
MKLTNRVYRAYLNGIVQFNAFAKSAAVRLTKLTGKSSVPIHPKHLIKTEANQHWYLADIVVGSLVLDVGCANGAHSLAAAAQAASVVGIDYNWKHLQTGKALSVRQHKANVAFLFGSVEQCLPFPNHYFDRVLLLDVIEHLVDRIGTLREIHRVLRPEGLLFVSAPNRDTSWKRRLKSAGLFYYTDPDHKVEYTLAELQAELQAGGFEVQGRPQAIVYDTPWAGLIDLTGGISLSLYRRLSRWKTMAVNRYPEETIGWRITCSKAVERSK